MGNCGLSAVFENGALSLSVSEAVEKLHGCIDAVSGSCWLAKESGSLLEKLGVGTKSSKGCMVEFLSSSERCGLGSSDVDRAEDLGFVDVENDSRGGSHFRERIEEPGCVSAWEKDVHIIDE
jgi:hypothetical protein